MESVLKLDANGRSTVLMAIGLMAVIIMMVLPVPAIMLDIGLTLSFAAAILIFTVVLFVERPLDFSSFPTVLLGSLMLRLSLNVSSTKLIIGDGHTGPDAAGAVIHGFSMFVMGGNIFLGLVVFGVLLIVNFMVITKGAGRMAEVGARFALDAMPGKQLAIDADVAAGALSHEEAKARRKLEQDETTFFGSLDGASKFVKGDAIAGLLITLLNLVVGLGMGIGVFGLSVSDAVTTYSILTVGDGLVSQIPAVIISIAAALLLSKGGVAGAADRAVINQLGDNPVAITTVGGIMAAFALMPGLPFGPFMLGAALLFLTAHFTRRRLAREAELKTAPPPEPVQPAQKPLGDILDVDEIHVEFSEDTTPLALDSVHGVEPRIVKIRQYVAEEFGFVVPPIRLTDNLDIPSRTYRIKVQGSTIASGEIYPDKMMVIIDDNADLPIPGIDVEEPVFHAPARWIETSDQDMAASLELSPIEPAEIVTTHLLETIKDNFARLMTRRALRRILDEFTSTSDAARARANQQLVDEFIPDKVPLEIVQTVFRLLLDERVPVRNLPVIFDAITEAKGAYTAPEDIAEFVRQRLARLFVPQLCSSDGTIPLLQVDPSWEVTFSENEVTNASGRTDVALQPDDFNRLVANAIEKINTETNNGRSPAIVVSANRRRFIQTILRAKNIKNAVLSYEEIDPSLKPLLVGVI